MVQSRHPLLALCIILKEHPSVCLKSNCSVIASVASFLMRSECYIYFRTATAPFFSLYGWRCLSVDHFGPDWHISATIVQTSMAPRGSSLTIPFPWVSLLHHHEVNSCDFEWNYSLRFLFGTIIRSKPRFVKYHCLSKNKTKQKSYSHRHQLYFELNV